MENIEKFFGLAVRRKREKMGISQEAFAAKAGIHRTYVSSIELGKVQVSIRIVDLLAQALELRLSELWRMVEKIAAKHDS